MQTMTGRSMQQLEAFGEPVAKDVIERVKEKKNIYRIRRDAE